MNPSKTKNRWLPVIGLASMLALFCLPYLVSAEAYNTVSLNFLNPTSTPPDIRQFFVSLYRFTLGISGVLAVGMIVVGSIYISVSAGSPDKQKEGKDMITSAVFGMLLVIGSAFILNTINPEIYQMKNPGGSKFAHETVGCVNATTSINQAPGTTSINANGKLVVGPCEAGKPPVNPETGQCQCYNKPPIRCNENVIKLCRPRKASSTDITDNTATLQGPNNMLLGITDGGGITTPIPWALYYRQDHKIPKKGVYWRYPFYIPKQALRTGSSLMNYKYDWAISEADINQYLGEEKAQCVIYSYNDDPNDEDEENKRVDMQPWIKKCDTLLK